MFGPLGLPEIILIFVVALLLFGPRQMPQIGRSIGRALGEFRRASNDFKRTIEEEVAAEEVRDVQRELRDVGSLRDHVLGNDAAAPAADTSSLEGAAAGPEKTIRDQDPPEEPAQ